ncbi:MAG TPA: GNAT family N-acetyltransferase [Pyrinomonadaceae bacterium]|jgi:putative acetyltransferase
MSINNINDVSFRPATNDDLDRITKHISGILSEYGLNFEPEAKDADLKDIEGNYQERGGLFEIMEDAEGNLLGTVGLYPLDQESCELRKMYLAPKARGRGLGKQALERTINQARALGFKIVTLETVSVLKEAINLYTRFGFVPAKTRHVSARCDQAYILKLTE